jgi:transcriptional regulator with XRE-family HTH domain
MQRMMSPRQRDRASAAIRLRTILDQEFARRKRVNARYSLRAFAKSVDLEHSTLSQLMRGRRTMTWKSIQAIAGKLRGNGLGVLSAAERRERFDSRLVAKRLGISVDEVNVILTDLCLFGVARLKGDS